MKHSALILAFLLSFTSLPAVGQEASAPTMEKVEAVAEQYFREIQKHGLGRTVDFMHPDALASFKDMLVPVFEVIASSEDRSLLDMTFGEDATFQTVQDSTPTEFMRAFMNLMMAQLDGETFEFDDLKVLGSIPEEDMVHVLTRLKIVVGPIATEQMEVITFRPYENSWKMTLKGEMKGMAQALRAGLLGARTGDASEAPGSGHGHDHDH